MKRLVLFLGALGAGVVLFGALTSGLGWDEIWEVLRDFSFSHALVIFLLTFLFFSLSALRWHLVLKSQKCEISFSDAWKAYLAGFSLLFFAPMFPFANELLRAVLLKEQHGIDFSKGMASVAIDRIIEVTANIFVVLAGGVIFLIFGGHAFDSFKTVAVVGFIGIWLFALALLYARLFQRKSIFKFFWRGNSGALEIEQEVFRFFRWHNPFFWQSMLLSFGKSAVGIARAGVIIFFFGKGVEPLFSVTIHGFYYLAALVPIPAALGSQEALQAVAFGVFGLGVSTGAAFALVVRAIEILFAVAGLALWFRFGIHVLNNSMARKGEAVIKIFSRKPVRN